MIDATQVERRLERWIADADRDEQAVASVLATAVVASRETLVSAVTSALSLPERDGARAAARLLDRPFVEHLADGYRIQEPLAGRLRARFRSENGDRYSAVAESLVQTEQSRLKFLADEDDKWFAQGRIAYYLTAIDPEQSARSFIDAFAHPPSGDPGPPRSWLSELVIRKEDELASQARAVAFFVGFQNYREGRVEAAAENFQTVLQGSERDAYRAIALHLLVTLSRARNADRSLREAIRLSSELGLVENEVMATNTLVYKLLASARGRNDNDHVLEAASMAERNLALAEKSGDRHLLIWCLSAMARVRWLAESRMGQQGRKVPADHAAYFLETLARARRLAESVGDNESAAEVINTAAQINRDRGEFESAVRILEDALQQSRRSEPAAAARRWAQTAGSMRGLVRDPELRERLERLVAELNRWLPPPPKNRRRKH